MVDSRTLSPPDVRFETEIEFCSPSWRRKSKYLSLNHWLTTKTAPGRREKVQRTIRYKLYEMAYYAGSVILEVGVTFGSSIAVPIRAAIDAGREVQYFGVDSDEAALQAACRKLEKKKLLDNALLYRGNLSNFRNEFLVTPTMVVINRVENVEATLKHLALFLLHGTPVLIPSWFDSRADLRCVPTVEGFEFCGRFGESVMLMAANSHDEPLCQYTKEVFQSLRAKHGLGADSSSVDKECCLLEQFPVAPQRRQSGKKWPFRENSTRYPETLPDGSPWPKISIVTPTYNQGKFIEETICSVVNQDYPNLEYIVVDGGSTDETSEILESYAKNIDHLVSEPDQGQSDAINKGMKLTSGEILTWLNSDDMLAPGTLYSMAMAFWKSKADMVVGTVQLLKDGEIVDEHLTSCPNGPLRLAELLDLEGKWLEGRFFFQPELMFTRDLWERAGGYVDNKLYYSMDHELWLRFAIAGAELHVIGRPTVQYRLHDEQKTHEDYRPELRAVNRRYVEKYGAPQSGLDAKAIQSLKSKKYRVAFVNDVGPRYGAGIAHGRLRDSIAAAGHDTAFYCAKPTDSTSRTSGELYGDITSFNPDLVVFGNLHNAGLGMDLVDQVSSRWPSLFVLHDLWATTGRCCYSGECTKYLTGCDAECPTAHEYPALQPEHVAPAFQHKLDVISRPRRLVLMANSDWTKAQAEKSLIGSKGVVKRLKYAFPTHQFEPRDKDLCREILGLPRDRFIVLFAAVNNADERKGLRHLFEALNRLEIENLLPVCIGHAHDQSSLYPGTVSMGYVDDPWRAALIYSAADIFVGPSLHEAFGQVFIEAAACGTPAVAYSTGGVVDAIEDGVTGMLAESIHPSALATQINRLYSDPDYRRDLAVWGRIEVENEWSFRSAYHHFNNVLATIPETLGFLPPIKNQFKPDLSGGVVEPEGRTFGILERGGNSILYGKGFCTPEEFRPSSGGTMRVRWAIGSTSSLTVRVSKPGPHSVVLRCLNPVPGQRLEVYLDGTHHRTIAIEHADFDKEHKLVLANQLSVGDHDLKVVYGHTFNESSGGRHLALMYLDVQITDTPDGQLAELEAAA